MTGRYRWTIDQSCCLSSEDNLVGHFISQRPPWVTPRLEATSLLTFFPFPLLLPLLPHSFWVFFLKSNPSVNHMYLDPWSDLTSRKPNLRHLANKSGPGEKWGWCWIICWWATKISIIRDHLWCVGTMQLQRLLPGINWNRLQVEGEALPDAVSLAFERYGGGGKYVRTVELSGCCWKQCWLMLWGEKVTERKWIFNFQEKITLNVRAGILGFSPYPLML